MFEQLINAIDDEVVHEIYKIQFRAAGKCTFASAHDCPARRFKFKTEKFRKPLKDRVAPAQYQT